MLVDFWTYTCINCIRTLPYLVAWDKAYRDKGLTIVGVHSPEFTFERNAANVARALKQNGITYPVAQDNELATWSAWGNQYWPAKYLIDAKGHVRYAHFGEGEYDKTESAIRAAARRSPARWRRKPAEDATRRRIGRRPRPTSAPSARRASRRRRRVGTQDLRARRRASCRRTRFALQGTWKVSDEAATAGTGASLRGDGHRQGRLPRARAAGRRST